MRSYILNREQRAVHGFTDVFILLAADFSAGFTNKQVTLDALAAGDFVKRALIDIRTLVSGPSVAPTVQVKINTAAVAITPTLACKTANYAITNNTVVGSAAPTAADNLVLDCQAGGGDGAAATAGEVHVWVERHLATDRTLMQL